MDENLQQIRSKIEAAEKQFANLEIELQGKKKNLAEKKIEQERAILSGIDTSKLITEILQLQIEIEGLYGALKVLGKNLEVFQSEKSSEAQKLALVQAENAKAECLKICQEIYLSLVESIKGTIRLKEKYAEYVNNMRGAKRKETHFNLTISSLLANLRDALPALLDKFPKAIFADGSMPSPESLKKSLLRR